MYLNVLVLCAVSAVIQPIDEWFMKLQFLWVSDQPNKLWGCAKPVFLEATELTFLNSLPQKCWGGITLLWGKTFARGDFKTVIQSFSIGKATMEESYFPSE